MPRTFRALRSIFLVALISPSLAFAQVPQIEVDNVRIEGQVEILLQDEKTQAKPGAARDVVAVDPAKPQTDPPKQAPRTIREPRVGRPVDPTAAPGGRNTVVQAVTARSFDAMQANFGLTLATVDDTLRSQLDIASGQGVVVVGIKPGSLVDQAGLKINDVILNLGDQRVMGVNQARGMILAVGKGAIGVKLIREGKPRELSLVGPEHPGVEEKGNFWIGVPTSPVDSTLRSHLSELPADLGLVVNDVVAESPAAKAGLKKNDILFGLGGKPIKSAEELVKLVQASEGKPVPLEILRAGKPTTIIVTPGRRVLAQLAINAQVASNDPFLQYYTYYVPRTGVSQPDTANVPGLQRNANIIRQRDDIRNLYDLNNGTIKLDLTNANQGVNVPNEKMEAWAKEVLEAIVSMQKDTALKEIKDSIESLRKAVEALEKAEKK